MVCQRSAEGSLGLLSAVLAHAGAGGPGARARDPAGLRRAAGGDAVAHLRAGAGVAPLNLLRK